MIRAEINRWRVQNKSGNEEVFAASGIKLLSVAADHMFTHTLNAILTRLELREHIVIWDELATPQRAVNWKMTQWCFIIKTWNERSDRFTHRSLTSVFNYSPRNDEYECLQPLFPLHPFGWNCSSRRQKDTISRWCTYQKSMHILPVRKN